MTDMHPLRAFRLSKNITLAQLGAELGVDKTTVMRWELRRIPAERVRAVSKITGISEEKLRPDLFGRGCAV
jgi:transcriptional regulator with XRE-family HTH domain